LEFPDLPERGELDLNEVKSSKYFFQWARYCYDAATRIKLYKLYSFVETSSHSEWTSCAKLVLENWIVYYTHDHATVHVCVHVLTLFPFLGIRDIFLGNHLCVCDCEF
jgi:hypothetical protein